MNDDLVKQAKVGKFFPIIFAILGILYCGFVFLYQTENPQDKQDLLLFLMGALVTLGGILALYQSYATQMLVLKLNESKADDDEGL